MVFAASSFADGWLLKAPYKPQAKTTWSITATASMNGEDHQATLKNTITISSTSDAEIKAKGEWTDVTVDGQDQPGGEETTWDIVFKPNGSIQSAHDDVDYARMLAPLVFIYPNREVKVGDKWTEKFRPRDGKDITFDYEVVEQTKVGDADALKIKGKLSEDGPMKGDTVYWIGKDGTLLKYELDLKGWVVPFAGNDTEFDAKIKGEIVK